ncbi:(2Fe-2S)-binding protein [Pseudokordiimonas caeni]|uniref:(2Fe-2S)-binding protein n=1 Tax=Pseudokordiimonas caeni TaxID=2997908 RepID=UPI00281124D4|nr:(2Fe-2S)-binding protein [Pseudokordiimonas caeni]
MYVCLCNGYTDKDIRQAVSAGGVQCADDAYKALGGSFCCGCCRDCANEILDEELPKVSYLAAE